MSGAARSDARMSTAVQRMYGSIAASTTMTLRPCRTTDVVTSSGAIGTGRAMSNVSRATRISGRAVASTARPSRAAGGPACWVAASHGPRVCSVDSNRSAATGT
jgi:hypothetical protein